MAKIRMEPEKEGRTTDPIHPHQHAEQNERQNAGEQKYNNNNNNDDNGDDKRRGSSV